MQQLGAEGIVLLGEPAFYARFGFRSNPNLTLPGVPPEYFLVLPFNSTRTIPTGIVTFNSAFFEP